jgi:RHS repeat-associated protein
VKGNDNTVDYTYFLDGLLKTQTEKKANGTLVSDNTVDYDLNGNRTRDVTKKMNADNHGAYLSTTIDRTYDPRDRVGSAVTTGDGAGTETYVHDANNNVVSQTVKGVTSTSIYDRNRLITTTASGVTSTYNYDPFGRLDTVTAAGTVVERNVYDGFDHVVENRKTNGGTTSTTRYTFDPMDRTSTKTADVGTAKEKTTTFHYIGLSSEVLDEESAGKIAKSYQYSPWGERLSQTKTTDSGGKEDGYFGYNPHTDVEQVTDDSGDTKATYGYTAYGSNDDSQFTGVDKPDAADPTKEPYNAYRFNAKRWDQHSGTYDMGFRDYSPGLNRFLTRDMYNGALADMRLGADPWTGNRYAFGGGNPISAVELDGHDPCVAGADCGYLYSGEKPADTSFCYGGNMSASCPHPQRLPRLPKHDLLPRNDQPEHREFDSAGFWEKYGKKEYMDQQRLLASAFTEYFCQQGPTACEQWAHWLGASGEDLVVDPAKFMDEDNFANDVNKTVDQYKDMAIRGCGAETCEYTFDSGWAPTLATSDENPVKVDYAGMGQVQLNVSGRIKVTRGSDGSVSVSGSYQISIFKAWNFDPGEYPEPHGITVRHDFVNLPAFGLARDYYLRGSSSEIQF